MTLFQICKWKRILVQMMLVLLSVMQIACTGLQAFNNTARAGDTVSAAYTNGTYDQNVSSRENTKIEIRDSNGDVTTYEPGDPRIKAIMNLYPDPASYMILASQTGQNYRSNEVQIANYADLGNSGYSDWRQTVAFFDLPDTMAPGIATIIFTTEEFMTANTKINIIDGVGDSHPFGVLNSPAGSTALERLQSLERSPSHVVKITGSNATLQLVQAIDVSFTHNPDIDNGGAGKAHVVNPRGDITSINWSDTGSTLRILVTPTKSQIGSPKKDILFYIAGGLTGITLSSISAIDINGDPVSDVGIGISPLIYSFSPENAITPGSTVTVTGSALCVVCTPAEIYVFIKSNGVWIPLAPTNLSSSSFDFEVPASTLSGDAVFWMQTPGGTNSKIIQIQ